MSQSPSLPLVGQEQFASLLTAGTPLLDVRAPQEFQHGAFPAAVNLPLLEDSEREQVGKTYRRAGQQAAIDLGYRLVADDIRQERLNRWQGFMQQHPDALLYCYRGGLRSRIVQGWLAEVGVTVPRIAGGYKALRRFLLNTIAGAPQRFQFLVVGGRTGSGKTQLLGRFTNSVDLEALARHRGSAFGRRVTSQPAQIDFENSLAIALLKLEDKNTPWLMLEDESRAVGSVSMPLDLHLHLRSAPLAVIEENLDYRANTILKDYIRSNFIDYRKAHPDNHVQLFTDYLLDSLARIQRRLGGSRYQEIRALMLQAIEQQSSDDSLAAHCDWIKQLLRHYYDPMYEYQLGKKLSRVVFRGNSEEFLRWAAHFNSLHGTTSRA